MLIILVCTYLFVSIEKAERQNTVCCDFCWINMQMILLLLMLSSAILKSNTSTTTMFDKWKSYSFYFVFPYSTTIERTSRWKSRLNIFFFNSLPLFPHILLVFNYMKQLLNKRNHISLFIKFWGKNRNLLNSSNKNVN